MLSRTTSCRRTLLLSETTARAREVSAGWQEGERYEQTRWCLLREQSSNKDRRSSSDFTGDILRRCLGWASPRLHKSKQVARWKDALIFIRFACPSNLGNAISGTNSKARFNFGGSVTGSAVHARDLLGISRGSFLRGSKRSARKRRYLHR